MPVFVAQHVPAGLDDFVAGYLECAEFTFTDCDEEGVEYSPSRPIRGWSAAARKRAKADCEKFMAEHPVFLAGYADEYGGSSGYSSEQCAGHDFWYTRNGHGVGFRDRGEGAWFRLLDEAAAKWSECDVYRTDSGWLDFM